MAALSELHIFIAGGWTNGLRGPMQSVWQAMPNIRIAGKSIRLFPIPSTAPVMRR